MDESITDKATSLPNSEAGLLGALLSNPELSGRLKSILSSVTEGKLSEEDAEGSREPPSTPKPTGTDGLSALLSDPTLLAKLPSILSIVKPLLSSISPSTPSPLNETDAKSGSPACRDNLLLALKPFLSPERRQAVDAMLRISKLGEILGQLK